MLRRLRARLLEARAGYYLHSNTLRAQQYLERALVLRRGLRTDRRLASVLLELGSIHCVQGMLAEAEKLLHDCANLRSLRPNSLPLAQLHLNLGVIANARGDRNSANELFQKALDIHEQQSSLHPQFVNVLSNLGAGLIARGETSEGKALLRRALKVSARIFSSTSPAHLNLVHQIARVLFDSSDYREAERCYLETLSALEGRTDSQSAAAFAGILNNLAAMYQATGRGEEAVTLLEKALSLKYRAVGSNHEEYGLVWKNLLLAYQQLSKGPAAKPLLEMALAGMPWPDPSEPAERARLLGDWGFRFVGAGDLDFGEKLLRASLVECSDGALLTQYGKLLGQVHITQHRAEDAARVLKQVLNYEEKESKAESIDLALTRQLLGAAYLLRADPEAAIPLLERALEVQNKMLGHTSSEVGNTSFFLGSAWASLERYARAETFLARALAIKDESEDSEDDVELLKLLMISQTATGNHLDSATTLQRILAWPNASQTWKELYTVLTDLGTIAFLEQKLDDAKIVFENVKLLRGRAGDESDLGYGHFLLLQTLVQRNLGELDPAESTIRKACRLCETLAGKDTEEFASCQNELGLVLGFKHEVNTARQHLLSALDIRRKLGERARIAGSLHHLSLVSRLSGDVQKAAVYCEEALAIRRDMLDPGDPDLAESLGELGLIRWTQARYSEAETLLCESLDAYRLGTGEESGTYAMGLNNLGLLYLYVGRYENAMDSIGKAVKIHEARGHEYLPRIEALNNLGSAYVFIGNHALAEKYCMEALDMQGRVSGKESPERADILNRLGLIRFGQGRTNDGKRLLKESLALRKRFMGKLHPDYAQSINNLATCELASGDFGKAEKLLRSALEINRAVYGPEHPTLGANLYALGLALYRTERHKEAATVLRDSLQRRVAAFGEHHTTVANTLWTLASAESHIGDLESAQAHILRMNAVDNRILPVVLAAASEETRSYYLESLRDHLDTLLSILLLGSEPSGRVLVEAFQAVACRKAANFELGVTERDAKLSKRYPQLEDVFVELENVRNELSALMLAAAGDREEADSYATRFKSLALRQEELQSQLARDIPDLRFEIRLSDVTLDAIKSKLRDGSVLIDILEYRETDFGKFQPGNPRYLAFVVDPLKPGCQFVDLGPSRVINELVRGFLPRDPKVEHLLDYKSRDAIRDVFSPLWRTLFEGNVENVYENVYIAPDGDLQIIPFELLPVDDRELRSLCNITYLTSARDLLNTPVPDPDGLNKAVVVSSPTFVLPIEPWSESDHLDRVIDLDGKGIQFTSLPGAALEGNRAMKWLKGDLFHGGDALDSSIKKIRSPRVLHISTHGFFLPDFRSDRDWVLSNEPPGRFDRFKWVKPMLRSGLALAGAENWRLGYSLPTEAEDGLLLADEIARMNLRGTELVVLSACDTGLGETTHGDGVFGLRRAFLLAGAQSLVLSLWKVDDLATAILMDHFYARLSAGARKDSALRIAQDYVCNLTVAEMREVWLDDASIGTLSSGSLRRKRELIRLRQSADERCPFAPPAYWAAFIFQGNARPFPWLADNPAS